jgi:hypothetical protein
MLSSKKFMHKFCILFFFLGIFAGVQAQELNCVVNINASQIQTSDRGIFRDMKQAIEQFMNNRKWTNDGFKVHEKINCTLLININKMPSIGNFTASVTIQSARPIYNTGYSSLVFNFADRDWEFEYIESLPLEYNDNSYTSNLTSILAFYAYMIIGVDYDTYSELGGTPYFQRAQQLVSNAQNSGRAGWEPLGSNRNRYWIMENFNNPQMVELRKAMYTYHRLALDTFDTDADKSRETILKGLREVKKIREINPSAIIIISFFDAKGKELANIFSNGNIQVRREAYDIISAIDPSNRASYEKIIKN